MSFRMLSVLSVALTSVSAIAGHIEYLGSNGHLPAVVCGGASGDRVNIKEALQGLSSSLEQLKKELSVEDGDIRISDLTHTVSNGPVASIGTCVLVSYYTERGRLAAIKGKDKASGSESDHE